jgi:hypothetical protein
MKLIDSIMHRCNKRTGTRSMRGSERTEKEEEKNTILTMMNHMYTTALTI